MILYRLAHPKFAADLSGTGAKLHGGRWNPPGIAVTYTSEHISLALLETLANAGTLEQLRAIKLVQIEIPDETSVHEIRLSALKKNWQADTDATQWIGQQVLTSTRHLLIKCPSAIVPREHNFLVNPLHPDFKRIKLVTLNDFYFDPRLFKPAEVSTSA